MTERARLSPAGRMEIFERHAFRCYVCGSDDPVDLDHVKPLHAGGEDNSSNLAPICRACHLKKSVKETSLRAKVKRLILSTARHKKAVTEKRRSPNAAERKKQRMDEIYRERFTEVSKIQGD